jgi:hypothetical protein
MRRQLFFSLVVAGAFAIGCSERVTQQSAYQTDPGTMSNVLISDDSLRTLIGVLFNEADAPNAEFNQMLTLLRRNEPPPDTAAAQVVAGDIVNLTISFFRSGQLKDPNAAETPANVISFVNGILEITGLPGGLTLAALDPDGAAAVISPESPLTTLVTETQFSGIQINTGQVPVTTLITITRLPNTPPPLLTPLDQFPFFYEFSASPPVVFNSDVILGVCHPSDLVIPNPSRLRIAHNVAPFTPNSVEILPLVNAPFIDCTNAVLSSAGFGASLLQNLARLALPSPLYAAAAGSGLGGTTKKLSPFGAVDTLGVMDDKSPLTQTGIVAGKPVVKLPKVILKTPKGVPMAGVTVTFAITQGGGTLTGPVQVTNAAGLAQVTSWTTGSVVGVNALTATATLVPGSGFSFSPMAFKVTTKKAGK